MCSGVMIGIGLLGVARKSAPGGSARHREGRTPAPAGRASKAPWTGKTCGLLLVSHPTDFNHPEPIRVRPPTDHNGKVFCKTFWWMGF